MKQQAFLNVPQLHVKFAAAGGDKVSVASEQEVIYASRVSMQRMESHALFQVPDLHATISARGDEATIGCEEDVGYASRVSIQRVQQDS